MSRLDEFCAKNQDRLILTNIGFNLYYKNMEKKYTVEFYETEKGEKPCLEFLNTLEVKLRAKAFRDMALLEEIRNLYFFFVGNKIIITHGFRKKTQKTPPEEIIRAMNYRKEYLARHPQKEEKK